MLRTTDVQTLRFRQETSTEQNQNFDEIVDSWWDKLTQSGEIELIQRDDEEENSDLEYDELMKKKSVVESREIE